MLNGRENGGFGDSDRKEDGATEIEGKRDEELVG